MKIRTTSEIKNELREYADNEIFDKQLFLDLFTELRIKAFEMGFEERFKIQHEKVLKEKYEKIMKERYEENVKEGGIRTILALYNAKTITREDAIKHLGISPSEFEHLLKNQEQSVQ
ncbi:MAG: hypothetical protein VZR11_04705 [Succinimonas sp.]|nr:hypothetical protein [Succinimonas sp.]